MRGYYSGYFSLLTILVLGSLSLLLLWLHQDSLHFYQRGLLARNNDLTVQRKLFGQYQQQYAQLCQPTSAKESAFSEELTVTGKHTAAIFYVDCLKEALFIELPKAKQNQPRAKYLNSHYLITQPVYAEPIYTSLHQPLLWIIDQPTVWQLDGTIYGVVISNADLKIDGKGKIVGAIISDQKVILGNKVKIEFSSSIVNSLNAQFSHWRVAKGGWHDF